MGIKAIFKFCVTNEPTGILSQKCFIDIANVLVLYFFFPDNFFPSFLFRFALNLITNDTGYSFVFTRSSCVYVGSFIFENRGGPVKLDSMWQHRLTRLVRDRYMYSIRITV